MSQRAIVTAGQSDVENAIAAIASASANVKDAQAELNVAEAQVDNAQNSVILHIDGAAQNIQAAISGPTTP